MSKHTATPWSIADDGRGNYHLEGATEGETVIALLCPREPGEEPTEEDWGNWRLMREAPALRRAAAVSLWVLTSGREGEPQAAGESAVELLRAALSGTQGEEKR